MPAETLPRREPGDPMSQEIRSFADLGLSEPLLRAVHELGYEQPTRAQAEIIPPALEGRDILGQSKAGTGRTAALGLPLLQRLGGETFCEALVLVPNREMAVRVGDDLRNLGRFTNVRVATVYGGQRVRDQAERLTKNPPVIVGTPARVMEMHARGMLPFENVRHVILEEVDSMLDLGFRDDIRRILGALTHERQTIFVSGAMTPEIEQLAVQYLRDPLHIQASEGEPVAAADVRQRSFMVEPWDKNRLLVHLLRREERAVTLVFCRSRQSVEALTEYLHRKGIDASAVGAEAPEPHGEPPRGGGRDRERGGGDRDRGRGRGREGGRDRDRDRDRERPRAEGPPVLVASDQAARGLDEPQIARVINFDLPLEPEVYLHRVGRAAGAGAAAEAWTFVTPQEEPQLAAIASAAGADIERTPCDDFQPGPPPVEVVAKSPPEEPKEAIKAEMGRARVAPPSPQEAADRTKFPSGLVPAALPARRMGGRLRTGRTKK